MKFVLPLVSAALLFAAPSAVAEPAGSAGEALDLDRVIAMAIERNAGFRAEQARRAEVEGAVVETAADAWPQIEVVSGWNRSRNPSLLNSPDFDDILEQFPDFEPGEQELWNLGVTVEQPIWSGGKVQAALDLAKLVVDVTDAQIETARLDLALEAATLYYDWLRAERAIVTLEAQRLARQASLDVVEARYELDDATELERLRAVASLAEVAPAVANAEGNRRVAASRLRALLGLAPGVVVLLLDPADDDAPAEPPALAVLMPLAAIHRSELRELDLQLDAFSRQRETTVADRRPQIDLTGAYGHQVRLLDDLGDSLFADWRIGIGMSWSVFDGGRIRGEVAQIDAQRDQAKWRLEELRRQVVAELEAGRAAWATARERLAAAQLASNAATEAARVAAESFRLGVALQADLLDAQDRAVAQELAAIEARYDLLLEDARLRRAVGLQPDDPFTDPPDPTSPDSEPAPAELDAPEEGPNP
ncbi:MAG: TolC family protein [Acidobacteriota bacterium]